MQGGQAKNKLDQPNKPKKRPEGDPASPFTAGGPAGTPSGSGSTAKKPRIQEDGEEPKVNCPLEIRKATRNLARAFGLLDI